MSAGKVGAVVALCVVTVLLAVCVVGVIAFPAQFASVVRPVAPGVAEAVHPTVDASSRKDNMTFSGFDTAQSSQASSGASAQPSQSSRGSSGASAQLSQSSTAGRPGTYPLVAQYDGIGIHSPVAPADITTVLFHQASYAYALVMDTALPEADAAQSGTDNPPRVNRAQEGGEWLDADALHLWRPADATAMDTSIDVGAPWGTTVRCPVSGTVVLVKDYKLFDICDDIEIHIQPTGRPDLDVVVLHTYDPLVKAGDKVVGGVTEMSHVRDIAESLGGDIQLMYYTLDDDPGNHAHVQVNDANYEGYRESKLEGAVHVA